LRAEAKQARIKTRDAPGAAGLDRFRFYLVQCGYETKVKTPCSYHLGSFAGSSAEVLL